MILRIFFARWVEAECAGSDCENIKPFYPFLLFIKFLIEFPFQRFPTMSNIWSWGMTRITHSIRTCEQWQWVSETVPKFCWWVEKYFRQSSGWCFQGIVDGWTEGQTERDANGRESLPQAHSLSSFDFKILWTRNVCQGSSHPKFFLQGDRFH